MPNPIGWLLDRLWYAVVGRIMPPEDQYEPEIVG